MTYEEYKNSRQKAAVSLPIFYAFNKEQFNEGMKKLGLNPNDTDKIYRLGDTGGYYKKEDSHIIHEFFNGDKLSDLMRDFDFAVDAFYYEMANHEYHINNYQGDYDVCSCFCSCTWEGEDKTYQEYLIEGGFTEETVKAFEKAKCKFLRDAEKNDWY